ncbi:MAG: hypothetical protein AN484_03380 [Aphanizomenon flos-aquae WA102]|uniref:Uncharacterized protein n=1 Tax=Aphanizomenon flos-aquae WA102 TaxID=1710896 RepID=A0A1B7X732_APHFL|nr:MAG: hypothetical protein AN484_03380 [Aphanizomenon flos-aquae WA102]
MRNLSDDPLSINALLELSLDLYRLNRRIQGQFQTLRSNLFLNQIILYTRLDRLDGDRFAANACHHHN